MLSVFIEATFIFIGFMDVYFWNIIKGENGSLSFICWLVIGFLIAVVVFILFKTIINFILIRKEYLNFIADKWEEKQKAGR